MKRLIIASLSIAFFSLTIAGAAPLKVVTSFSILADLAKNIGQEDIEVQSIIGPDQDAHSFEPSPKDILTIQDADVVILNGVDFDNWLKKILTANDYKGRVIDASLNVPLLTFNEENHADHDHDTDAALEHSHDNEHEHHLSSHEYHGHDHDHGEFDPHIWQNPLNVIIMTKNIEEGFADVAPEKAENFATNFKNYQKELEALNHYAIDKLTHDEHIHLMVLHNSFGYLAKQYHLHFIAVSDLNPVAEPSAKKMAELYTLVKEEDIRAIFSENIAPSRFISTLANDLHLIDGGILYSDALTKEAPAKTYVDLFKHNVDQISKILQK